MNEHGDEIRFLEDLAGRHWKILAKIGTATVNADTPEEKAIMIDRYLKMKRVYERRLSDLMKARSGLTQDSRIILFPRFSASQDLWSQQI